MNHAPLVSILMNCYNGEKYLQEAVDSILSQTYQNWELVFWDNRSTDKSAEIFLNNNRRVMYLTEKYNRCMRYLCCQLINLTKLYRAFSF